MATYYMDSSALVKRYRREDGTDRVRHLLQTADRVVIADLSRVEVSAAIVRRGRAAGMSSERINATLSALDRDLDESLEVVGLDSEVIDRSVRMARTHSLRGADAIQLACALVSREQSAGEDYAVMATDRELNAAARAEGLDVVDPTMP